MDFGSHDTGLDLKAGGVGRCQGVVDRVTHREEPSRGIAVAPLLVGEDRPDRSMGILPAVLAQARRMRTVLSAFDIARPSLSCPPPRRVWASQAAPT